MIRRRVRGLRRAAVAARVRRRNAAPAGRPPRRGRTAATAVGFGAPLAARLGRGSVAAGAAPVGPAAGPRLGRPRSLPARRFRPSCARTRPPAAACRTVPNRNVAAWSRAASRRGLRGGSSTARPVVRRRSRYRQTRRRPPRWAGVIFEDPGGDLLSQGVYPQVPSARAGLTAVFGMGTGVSPPPWPPGNLSVSA